MTTTTSTTTTTTTMTTTTTTQTTTTTMTDDGNIHAKHYRLTIEDVEHKVDVNGSNVQVILLVVGIMLE